MKRSSIFIFILIFIYGSLTAQAQKPEKIYSVARVAKPHSYYVIQAALWWQEIEKNGKNEKAWYNYYKANRYAKTTSDGSESWIEESSFLKEPDATPFSINLFRKHVVLLFRFKMQIARFF